jgi:membrane dipeptidase
MKRITILLAIIAFIAQSCNNSPKFNSIEEKAAYIHNKAFTVDSHTDTPMSFTSKDFDFGKDNSGSKRSRVDIPRMEQGGLDGVWLAAFLGQKDRNDSANLVAKERAEFIISNIHRVAKENNDKAEIALNPTDGYRLEKEGKRALYIGIENGYPLGTDLSLVRHFYDLGARYITLCHSRNNDICDSSTDDEEHDGLSDFGKEVVVEMNKLGMLVDVSHMSDKSFFDVIDISKTPIIASHSCARAICDNPRNLDDEMLVKLAENGGVIQMCILSNYVKKLEQPANQERDEARKAVREKYNNFDDLTVERMAEGLEEWYAISAKYPQVQAYVVDVVDHIDHIVKVAGIDHVGIGTDFDGGGGITDCKDVSELGNITIELVKRGYTEEEIIKIWGGNFMRVFNEVIEYTKP